MTLSLPLSIGTVGSPYLVDGPLSERLSLLEQIQAAAIDHLFIADHISFHTGMGMDGLINAATLAAMGHNYKILVGVYLLALRHPVPVARQLASLSASAPGRIVLGIGIGGEDPHELEICGVDPKKRGAHTNHSLAALRGLMSGEPGSYDCEFFSYEDALIVPAPAPAIPLVIGGRSDAAIRRTGRQGDGWLGLWCSPTRYEAVLNELNDHAAEAGRSPQWHHGLQFWFGTGANEKEARGHVAAGMEEMYRIPFEKFEKYSPYGTAEHIAEFLAPYIEAGARYLNFTPRGPSWQACIEAVHDVSVILKKEFPDLTPPGEKRI